MRRTGNWACAVKPPTRTTLAFLALTNLFGRDHACPTPKSRLTADQSLTILNKRRIAFSQPSVCNGVPVRHSAYPPPRPAKEQAGGQPDVSWEVLIPFAVELSDRR
jgi:hypothetical protein